MIGGAVGDAKCRGRREIGVVGHEHRLARVEQRLLGEPAEGGSGHPLTRAERRTIAGGDHFAGHLVARYEGRRNLQLILAGD